MASRRAVATALAILAEGFGGTVSEAKAEVYYDALLDVADEDLGRAVRAVVRTYEGKFIPPPAVLRNAVGANDRPAIDSLAVVDAIQELVAYRPSGLVFPSVDAVRRRLGSGIAQAYAVAGGARIFSSNETTRDIARREFAQELEHVATTRGKDAIALPRRARVPMLASVTFDRPAPMGGESGLKRISAGELKS